MMARSRSSNSKSNGSCKMSGNSMSHSTSSSSSGSRGDGSCSSSCGHTIHVRKKIRGHSGLQCRYLSGMKNTHMRKRCEDFVSPHAWTRSAHCHISKESHCHFKRLQSHECCTGTTREDEDRECCVKKQKCQHTLPNFSDCLFGSFLPCNWCCGSCHKRLLSNQEPDEMTKVYYNQRRNLCKRHDHHCYCHHHDNGGPFCENHLSPTGNDCRSDCTKKTPNQACVINAGLEKNLAGMEGHGPLEGNVKKGLTATNNFASTQDFLQAKEKDWLTLNLPKPPKPTIADFNSDDIKLGLPGNAYSVLSKTTQEIDLHVTAKNDNRSFTDVCAPTIPLSRDFGSQMLRRTSGSSQDLVNYKVSHTNKGGTTSCQKESNIVTLDDTDDEYLQNDNPKMGAHFKNQLAELKREGNSSTSAKKSVMESVNQPAKVKKEGDSSTSVKRGVMESLDDCTAHVREAEESTAWKDNNFEGPCIQADKEETGAVERSESGWSESKKQPNSFIQSSTTLGHSAMIGKDTEIQGMHDKGFKPRKKRMIDKRSLPLWYPEENNDESNASEATVVATVIVQKAVLSKMVEAKPRMWEDNILCDLCRKGPSLSMGEWYAWCCGLRLHRCGCAPAVKMKLKLALSTKKSNKPKKTDGVFLSGMVHKMCALWSSEVYEEEERLQGLLDAVKRGKSLICASCREYGATLGCRVKACRRSFHYPCADELASKLCCRMWDGVQDPVACRGHRYVSESCTNAKEKQPNWRKWRFRGFVLRKCLDAASGTPLQKQSPSFRSSAFKECGVAGCAVDCPQPKLSAISVKEKNVDALNTVIDISSDSEDEKKMEAGIQCNPAIVGPNDPTEISLKEHDSNKQEIGGHRLGDSSHALYHMGSNLLCEDISCGHEAVLIPCTNDVDSDPAPVVNYIIENRYLGRAKFILESLLLDKTRAAVTCKGCDLNSIDNPNIEASVHAALSNFQRESDTRFDWQGQSMLGRLPYDWFGRLQLGPDTKDIVECNSRCPCGVHCLNRELQRGLRTPLEVFKTKDRGWGVRTMEQICRGKFVVEYIGEVLTHDEAHERGIEYDLSNFSCLFSADHPDVPVEDLLVIDGFQMSNVARFVNHSCDGNLRVYRIYTETTDLRFCRIGLYALRDIEIGEELSYDYGYAVCKDGNTKDFSTDPTSIKCMCGASNCKQWLWTGTSR